jgi:site-specific DNA-adenine methylase
MSWIIDLSFFVGHAVFSIFGIYLAGKYPGSKARLFPTVWELVPPHRHHVVLFGGIGAELCAKPVASFLETVIDKKDDERIIKELEHHMFSEADFFEQCHLLRSDEPDKFKRAVAFFLVAMQSRGMHDPTCPVYQTWSLSMKSHRNTQCWVRIRERLAAVARRFREVQLPDSGRDWSWAVDKCDSEETVFTADPPYMLDTVNSETRLYTYTMTDAEHEFLLLRLRKIKGFAMVFHYDHPLYRTLLADWNLLPFPQVVSMSPKNKRPVRDTLVWRNW